MFIINKRTLSPAYCAIFRILAAVIDYMYLSLPVIAGKNEHRLVLFAGKSKHHLDLVDTFFTTANFYIDGSRFNSEYCIITACMLTDAITSQAIAIQP